MKTVRDLLTKLRQSKEDDSNLLDRTSVFLGSNLGDASSHSTKNLPVFLAGGASNTASTAFRSAKPAPLCNLYVSMLQRLGIETDRFGTSNGMFPGLAMA